MSCNLYRLITNKLPWPENLIGYKLSNYIMDLSKDVRIIERIPLFYMLVSSMIVGPEEYRTGINGALELFEKEKHRIIDENLPSIVMMDPDSEVVFISREKKDVSPSREAFVKIDSSSRVTGKERLSSRFVISEEDEFSDEFSDESVFSFIKGRSN